MAAGLDIGAATAAQQATALLDGLHQLLALAAPEATLQGQCAVLAASRPRFERPLAGVSLSCSHESFN